MFTESHCQAVKMFGWFFVSSLKRSGVQDASHLEGSGGRAWPYGPRARAGDDSRPISGISNPAPFALAPATETALSPREISEVSSGSDDGLVRHARGNS